LTLISELSEQLDIGEASSIALALEIPNCLLIIDERKGRRTARKLGIEITGTFGIIMMGFESGLIEAPDTIVERLEKVGFRISEALKASMRTKFH
jgi:predicted nucleic acid-binding protein